MNFESSYQYLISHWPFIAFSFVMMIVTQVCKSAVFTKKRAHMKGKAQWFFWWAYKTLPLHPVVAGFIIGAIWRNPEGADPAWPVIASMFYFAVAGGISVWLYQIIKGVAKKRGYDLSVLPGQTPLPKMKD